MVLNLIVYFRIIVSFFNKPKKPGEIPIFVTFMATKSIFIVFAYDEAIFPKFPKFRCWLCIMTSL